MKGYAIILALATLSLTACGSGNSNNATEGSKVEQAATAVAEKSETLTVQGSCEMCKERIESTAKAISGVKSAEWSLENKVLNISFDDSQTNLGAISKALALVGHDTNKDQASEDIYNTLPGCCQYR